MTNYKVKIDNFLSKIIDVFKSKFISDSFITLIATLIVAMIGFVINIVIAKMYNEEILGIYNQVYSVYNILFFISLFGFNRTSIKYISESSDSKKRLSIVFYSVQFSVVIITAIVLSLAYSTIFVFHTALSDRELYIPLVLILLALPFYVINNIIMCTLNGIRSMVSYSVLRMMRWILLIIVLLTVTIIFDYYIYIFYSFLISETINFLIGLYLLKNKLVKVRLKEIIKRTRVLFRYSTKVFYSQLFNVLKERSDVLIIGYFTNNKVAGIYSLMASSVKGLFLIGNVIQQNFNPIFVRKINQKEVVNNYIKKLKKYSVLIFIPITICMTLFYYILVENILYDKDFNEYYFEFLLMTIGGYIFSAYIYAGGLLVMGGELISNIKRTFLVLIAMILLTVILTYFLNIRGAALAFTSLMFVEVILLKYYIKKKLKINI